MRDRCGRHVDAFGRRINRRGERDPQALLDGQRYALTSSHGSSSLRQGRPRALLHRCVADIGPVAEPERAVRDVTVIAVDDDRR